MQVNAAIIGLDRVGTSFGLALKRYEKQPKADHKFTIIGSDPRAQAMKDAQKLGAVDNFNRALLKATGDASLIIVNVPFGSVQELYERLGPKLKPGTVVLDTSLHKTPIIEWAKQYFPHNDQGAPLAYLVGITPIINASGLYSGEVDAEFARADLFDGCEFLMTPDSKCPPEAISLAEDIITLMGGKPRFMDLQEHDGLIAATEELPALLGAALFYNLARSDGWLELRRMVNPTMALSMQSLRTLTLPDIQALFSGNRQNLLRHLEALIGTLDQVRDALEKDDPTELEVFLSAVYRGWEKWDIKRHSGQWEDVKEIEALPGPLNMGGLNVLFGRRKKDEDDEDDDD